MKSKDKIYEHYIIYIGGTSVRQAIANTHLRFMEQLYGNGSGVVPVHTIVPAMDQSNPDINLLEKIFKDEKTILGTDQYISIIRLYDYIGQPQDDSRQDRKVRTDSRFGEFDHPILNNHLYLPSAVDDLEITHGYCSNQAAGAIVAPQAFEKAVEDDTVKNGLNKIIEQVVNSNGNQVIHVVLCGASGWGAEGRTHTNILPEYLFRKCVGKLVGAGRMSEKEAEQHVLDHLLFDVIMHGSYFRFPALDKDKDVKRLTRETLVNFDLSSAEHIHAFGLIEHDLTCVLAEKPSEYGNQYRHAHAGELAAFDMTEKFIQDPNTEKCCVLPHYAAAGPQTNWSTLGVSDEMRRMIISFIRFYAVLEYFLKPQLGTCIADIKEKDLYNTRFMARVYKNYGNDLKSFRTRDDLEKEILTPFWTMYRRAREIVRWIYEISLTGKDWETCDTTLAEEYTSLFNVEELDRLLNFSKPLPRIDQFNLDSLSECKEGNPASTGLTPDNVILRLNPSIPGDQYTFMDIMMEIYRIVRV